MKVLKVDCTRKSFFVNYLNVINVMLNIRPTALAALAGLLYYNNEYKALSKEDRDNMIFSYAIRKKITDDIEMSRASFDNQLTYLRKKNIIKGNGIAKQYEIFYETHKDLLFSFKFKEESND